MSARDSLLDAYQALLLDEGERAATLDAVAARAGVSKGGLLYHFRSKEALAAGLIGRLEELVAADRDQMRDAPDGPSRYYVRNSVWSDSPVDRTLVAVAQLAQESHPPAREAMARARDQWLLLILEEVGDRATAHAILLIGDGLYFDAALTGGFTASVEDAEALVGVVDRLIASVAAPAVDHPGP